MSPHTVSRILAAFDRVEKELGIGYDKLIKSTPVVVVHALVSQDVALNRVLPNAADLKTFEGYLKRIETKADLKDLLDTLDEPSVEDLGKILSLLRSLPASLKERYQISSAQIRPTGGPPELLSDPVEVSAMVDEIFERRKKTGASLGAIQEEIADERDMSLKTVQRRYIDEMERRRSIAEWLAKRKIKEQS